MRITYYLKYCLVKRCVSHFDISFFSYNACHIIIMYYVIHNDAEPPPTSHMKPRHQPTYRQIIYRNQYIPLSSRNYDYATKTIKLSLKNSHSNIPKYVTSIVIEYFLDLNAFFTSSFTACSPVDRY